MDQAAGTKNQKLLYQNFSLAFIDTHKPTHLGRFYGSSFSFFYSAPRHYFFQFGSVIKS